MKKLQKFFNKSQNINAESISKKRDPKRMDVNLNLDLKVISNKKQDTKILDNICPDKKIYSLIGNTSDKEKVIPHFTKSGFSLMEISDKLRATGEHFFKLTERQLNCNNFRMHLNREVNEMTESTFVNDQNEIYVQNYLMYLKEFINEITSQPSKLVLITNEVSFDVFCLLKNLFPNNFFTIQIKNKPTIRHYFVNPERNQSFSSSQESEIFSPRSHKSNISDTLSISNNIEPAYDSNPSAERCIREKRTKRRSLSKSFDHYKSLVNGEFQDHSTLETIRSSMQKYKPQSQSENVIPKYQDKIPFNHCIEIQCYSLPSTPTSPFLKSGCLNTPLDDRFLLNQISQILQV